MTVLDWLREAAKHVEQIETLLLVNYRLMEQLKEHGHSDVPPAMATDGNGSYREAIVGTWDKVPEYSGLGRPTTKILV